jgi:hypothetical protein
VVDPSQTPLVTFSDAAREFSQLADHNYCTFFDNLSHLRDWMSDALCRLVTGDSFVKRKLYSNDEDIIFSYMRVAGLSGINQIATKPDLLDRSLLLGLERVADAQRVEETVLWAKFNQLLPSILGGVLDAVSYALKRAPSLTLHHRPRLVDFYRYALAVSEYLGFTESDLIGAIVANTHRQNQEALESSPTAQTIIQFMSFQDNWEGRSYELYEKLLKLAEDMKINKDFPKSPIWLWRRIKEVRSNLKAIGIDTDKHEISEGTMISLTKSVATPATTAINQGDETSQASGSNGNNGSTVEETEALVRETMF